MVLKAEGNGTEKDPCGNQRQAFSARTRLNGTDFGLKYNMALEAGGVRVGEKIEIELDISAVRAQVAPPAQLCKNACRGGLNPEDLGNNLRLLERLALCFGTLAMAPDLPKAVAE